MNGNWQRKSFHEFWSLKKARTRVKFQPRCMWYLKPLDQTHHEMNRIWFVTTSLLYNFIIYFKSTGLKGSWILSFIKSHVVLHVPHRSCRLGRTLWTWQTGYGPWTTSWRLISLWGVRRSSVSSRSSPSASRTCWPSGALITCVKLGSEYLYTRTGFPV